MAEDMMGKVKRNVKRAFDFRSSADIRNARDTDETSSNIDYMLSRGKNRTPQDQSGTEAGKRTEKKFTPPEADPSGVNRFLGIRKKIVDTISGNQSSNQGPAAPSSPGVAATAMQTASRDNGVFRNQRNAPAVRLFKNLRKKNQGPEAA